MNGQTYHIARRQQTWIKSFDVPLSTRTNWKVKHCTGNGISVSWNRIPLAYTGAHSDIVQVAWEMNEPVEQSWSRDMVSDAVLRNLLPRVALQSASKTGSVIENVYVKVQWSECIAYIYIALCSVFRSSTAHDVWDMVL